MWGAAAMLRHWLSERDDRLVPYALTTLFASLVWLTAPTVTAQAGCALTSAERNPSEKVLRCGDHLTIRIAPNTRYRLTKQDRGDDPKGAELDFGALMIEFKPSPSWRNFQILTPHAIAAVRGTTWAVEIDDDWTATLVVLGFVEVRRPNATEGVVLRAGQGTDVTAGTRPIIVKRWAKPRVDALLARFGR
jgi:FecR protein